MTHRIHRMTSGKRNGRITRLFFYGLLLCAILPFEGNAAPDVSKLPDPSQLTGDIPRHKRNRNPIPLLAPAPAEPVKLAPLPNASRVAAPPQSTPLPLSSVPHTAPPPVPATVPGVTRELSVESREVFKRIPRNTFPIRGGKRGRHITVEHTEDPLAEPDPDEALRKDEMGIVVKSVRGEMTLGARLEKAFHALSSGHEEAAKAMYKAILKTFPNNKHAMFGLATTYQRNGHYLKARELYRTLLRRYPDHKGALNNFIVLAGKEAPLESLGQLDSLARDNPGYIPVISAQKAMIHYRLGNLYKAIALIQTALKSDPENLVYRFNAARILDEAGQKQQALALYESVLDARHSGASMPAPAQQIEARLEYLRVNVLDTPEFSSNP